MQRPFIENCFCLTPKRVDESLNRIGRRIGDNTDFERKDIRYDYEEVNDEYSILATVAGNEPQRVRLETIETWFGERQYFLCEGCNARRHKLFLLPGGHIFRCFKCHKVIRYQKFNTSSRHGRMFDRTRRIVKLVNERAEMSPRIFYKSAYTRRYSKFLDDCLKVGLNDIVADSRALESAIKAND